MTQPAKRHTAAILPWWQILLVLVACGFGVWFLLPDDQRLIDDLLRDGKTKEARRVLEKLSPAQRARRLTDLRLLEVRLARLELPPVGQGLPLPSDAAALDRFWRESLAAWRETDYSAAIFLEFTPVLPRLGDLAAAQAALAPILPRAPAAQRARLGADFVKAALAANQPVVAASTFALAYPEPRVDADRLELARLWQLAGRPADALAALGDSSAPEVATRRLALLRALNRNPEALALLRARADSTPLDSALLDELATVALAAGEPATAAPYVQRYLTTAPTDLAAQRRLRDLFLAAGQPAAALPPAQSAATLSSRASSDLRELARIYEYTTQPALAFDTWLELILSSARAGSPANAADSLPALDRLVALNPGLYRDADLARALDALEPIDGRPDLTLKHARVEVSVGRYDAGRLAFERYLAAVPTDVDAIVEFARLHTELYRFADAERWTRLALTKRPDDLPLRRQLADLLVLAGRSTEALDVYAELVRVSDDEEILGPYIRLAESLGRYADFTAGLRRRIARSPENAARDYLLLAYGYELLDDPVRRRAALDDGLRSSPRSDDVRLQLAFSLAAEKKYQAAQATLTAHPGLHSDTTAATLYLDLLLLNNDTAAERRYLATPLAPALAHDEAILERIARVHEALRNFPEAERLWRELHALRPAEVDYTASLARVLLTRGRPVEAQRLLAPLLRTPTPAILKLSAEIAEASGDHRAAEKYQLAYLDAVRAAPYTDWGALGDIRLSRGDRTGAKRAYAEALRRLKAQLAQTGGSE